jgi:hypothetical protein
LQNLNFPGIQKALVHLDLFRAAILVLALQTEESGPEQGSLALATEGHLKFDPMGLD